MKYFKQLKRYYLQNNINKIYTKYVSIKPIEFKKPDNNVCIYDKTYPICPHCNQEMKNGKYFIVNGYLINQY